MRSRDTTGSDPGVQPPAGSNVLVDDSSAGSAEGSEPALTRVSTGDSHSYTTRETGGPIQMSQDENSAGEAQAGNVPAGLPRVWVVEVSSLGGVNGRGPWFKGETLDDGVFGPELALTEPDHLHLDLGAIRPATEEEAARHFGEPGRVGLMDVGQGGSAAREARRKAMIDARGGKPAGRAATPPGSRDYSSQVIDDFNRGPSENRIGYGEVPLPGEAPPQ